MKRCVQPFTQALKILEDATGLVETAVKSQPERCAAAATDYLCFFGLVALGFMWVRMAVLSVSHTGGPEADFYRAKLATARFFLERLPPQVGALSQLIATADTTLTFDPKAF
jgi:butyryl-CoA dehydrogenase